MLPFALVAALALTEPEPEPEYTPEPAPEVAPEPEPEVTPEPEPEYTPEPAPAPTALPRAGTQKDYNAPWRQGRSRFAVAGGVVGLSGSNDFYFGMTYGYFIVDNLELGVDVIMTFGDQPFTARVGPSLLYVIPVEADVQPYVGGFYRHWFVADDLFLDQDTLGGRAGVILRSGGTFLQLGLVAEGVVSECDDDCMSYYPELGFSISL